MLSCIQSTTLTYLDPVLAAPSVWAEGVGAGGELVSMGCDATAPLTEERGCSREDEDSSISGCEWELVSPDTPCNT